MILTEIILIISFFINLGLGIIIFTRPAPFYKKINLIFSLLCLTSALWGLGVFMVFIFKDIGWKLFWIRFVFAASSFIPGIFSIFH